MSTIVQHNGEAFNSAYPPTEGRLCLVDTGRKGKRWILAYYRKGDWVTSNMTGDVVQAAAKTTHAWAYMPT